MGPEFKRHSEHYGTSTINGLVDRGIAVYTAFKEGRNGKFPIEVTFSI